MTIDLVSDLLTPSGATLKFTEVGQIHRIVIDEYRVEQATDYVSGEPAFFSNGNPKQNAIFIGTSEGEPAKLYLKYWGKTRDALSEAFRTAGVQKGDSLKGGTLIVKFEGVDEPTQPGLNGAKRFRMKYEPPKQAVVDDDLI